MVLSRTGNYPTSPADLALAFVHPLDWSDCCPFVSNPSGQTGSTEMERIPHVDFALQAMKPLALDFLGKAISLAMGFSRCMTSWGILHELNEPYQARSKDSHVPTCRRIIARDRM